MNVHVRGMKLDVTYEMYSFSVLVYRTSGSLPRRPIRSSFAMSAEREEVVENACTKDTLRTEFAMRQIVSTHAQRRARSRAPGEREHGRQQEGVVVTVRANSATLTGATERMVTPVTRRVTSRGSDRHRGAHIG